MMANLTPKYCGLPEFVCLVYLQSVFVKNRDLWPDKNKFAFALEKLTMELDVRFRVNKSRLIWILIAFLSSLFDNYNFCNVKFSPGLLMTLSVPL